MFTKTSKRAKSLMINQFEFTQLLNLKQITDLLEIWLVNVLKFVLNRIRTQENWCNFLMNPLQKLIPMSATETDISLIAKENSLKL